MTKEVFAGFFKKAIPVVGGVVGGGLTFVSFKPCCDKLRKTFGQATTEEKDSVSHRAIAMNKIKDYLESIDYMKGFEEEDEI